MAKPISAKEAAGTAPTEGNTKSKSKKLLLIIIGGVLMLGIAGGAGWYFSKGENHNGKGTQKSAKSTAKPIFIPLEPFTVNLQRERTDQFLQIGISLKIFQEELQEQIKQNLPEIRSRLLVLLSGKRPSELTTSNGKKRLVNEIIAETEFVLGLRRTPFLSKSNINAHTKPRTGSSVQAENLAEAVTEVEETTHARHRNEAKDNVIGVLFTSFIIQ
ncbi:flagellar basal body-associated protein FliL [Candidatus Nitrotoga sp. M5]|uniref:flagellar basal body-associated protein FliL n=1 Tax=Candidatus Nitrotoga sp. M5 TaxID=2890409 RepID=UPI001EF704B2|nr:flagellar basal body-associated protein FliL [Candidatus Nitrotoga sp. M5]CAH1387760.1 Flagellar protein FliL [Candidatus Nitrotoga sp. M5]